MRRALQNKESGAAARLFRFFLRFPSVSAQGGAMGRTEPEREKREEKKK